MKKQFTLIELMIVIAIIAIIAAIAIPNLLEARKHGNEASAIGTLKFINAGEVLYLERSGSDSYTTLGGLRDSGYIDGVIPETPSGFDKSGYRFLCGDPDVHWSAQVGGIPVSGTGISIDSLDYEYAAAGAPIVFGSTGNRSFYTNQSGVIFFKTGNDQASAALIDRNSLQAIGGK